MEQWRPIPGWDSYRISNHASVQDTTRGQPVSPARNSSSVHLRQGQETRSVPIGELMLTTWPELMPDMWEPSDLPPVGYCRECGKGIPGTRAPIAVYDSPVCAAAWRAKHPGWQETHPIKTFNRTLHRG